MKNPRYDGLAKFDAVTGEMVVHKFDAHIEACEFTMVRALCLIIATSVCSGCHSFILPITKYVWHLFISDASTRVAFACRSWRSSFVFYILRAKTILSCKFRL
jgi:hypothetical protein